MAKVAFLGTGLMGTGMAARMIDAGHQVVVFNRTKSRTKRLVDKGATYAATPALAADQADIIFSMVGDDTASQAIWLGEDGALNSAHKSNTLIIECSTLSHDWVLELAKKAKLKNITYLDSPVTGLPDAAANGQLTLFLGGDQESILAAQPYLDIISAKQIHFGPIGSGTAYKLIVNLMGSIQIAAAAEGLITAERAGLDLNLVAKALANGGCGSPQVARNSELMAKGDHESDILFSARWRLKDTDYGLKYAQKLGLQPVLGQAAITAFSMPIEHGYSHLAETKVIDTLRAHITVKDNK